ncbi:MAG: hypothetical protein NMNS01_14670 [Nitrosomonas sp.]|nr:MAG: hypothetical protein NMNS01_14670 [Nitrosomonas sp.]
MPIPTMLNHTNGQFKLARNVDGLAIIKFANCSPAWQTDVNREKPLHACGEVRILISLNRIEQIEDEGKFH